MTTMFEKFNIGNLRIGVKLALMVLAPVIVLLYFAGISLFTETRVVTEANDIQELVRLSVAVGDFVHESQKERGRTATFVASEGTLFASELEQQRAFTDGQINALQQAINETDTGRFGPEFNARLAAALTELDRLDQLRNEVDQLALSPDQATDAYTGLHTLFFDVISVIPSLSTDGEIADIANGYAIFLRAKDRVDLERAILGQAFTRDRFEPGQFVQFTRAVAEREVLTETFLKSVSENEVAIFNSTVQGAVIEEVDRVIQIAFDRAEEGDFGVNPDDWFQTVTGKVNLFKQIEDVQANILVTAAQSLQEQAQSRLIVLNAIRAGGAIIAVVLAFVISGGITRQIGHISDLFGQVGIGDFDARAKVIGNDELGQMAASLNAMLDTLLSLVQTQEERDALQASIQKLLEEVSDVAVGDLTVEAEVTADATGAIADSFNFMIDQLRQVISSVQETTAHVSNSANEIRLTAEYISEGSESQATQIVDTSAAIDEMAVSIQQVSENATLSASVADQALNNAQQGTTAVQATIAGMDRIRDQVRETAKRITRLGESSQQIGEIVQLIGDIADRTSILALNASIQAAMAGEAGRGFAVVAEEVERLAERATDATRQIANLVKTIQTETGETVTAMEESTQEVLAGSHLADQAGQALGQIEDVSNQLAELIQSISLASQQQARGSEAVARSMGEIAEVTQVTASSTKQAAVSLSDLADLADNLRASVSAFKLPPNGNNGRVS